MRTNAHSSDASGYWLLPSPEKCLMSSRGFPPRPSGGLLSIEELHWIAERRFALLDPTGRSASAWISEEMRRTVLGPCVY